MMQIDKIIDKSGIVKVDKEKKSLKTTTQNKKEKDINKNRSFRILLKGIQRLNSNKSPLNPVKITQSVDISVLENENILEIYIINDIANTIVIPQGKDLLIMLLNKFPLIRLLFGSSANTKDGIPIVSTLVNVI